mmetsp:Transcript_14283/g.26748  ORF Transcript_14283/g.26748 Transcript_14283/m.26748 type:complete len:154 (-) Transcript_14283:318-779(-)
MSKKSSGGSKELQLDMYDEFEEDNGCIQIADDKCPPPASPARMQGMSLDLSLTLPKSSDFLEESPLIQESSILVVFDLPDGSVGEQEFKLGNTVEVLKSFVEMDYGIPMTEQTMFMGDQLLMDPMSLLDYPEAKSCDELYVRVEGVLPTSSRK